MAGNIVELTDANWEAEVVQHANPVMVDFWAPWCAPCRALLPIIEKLSEEYDGKVKFGKMNTDEQSEKPGELQISAIPTVLVFKDGEIVDKLVGVTSDSKFRESLEKLGVTTA